MGTGGRGGRFLGKFFALNNSGTALFSPPLTMLLEHRAPQMLQALPVLRSPQLGARHNCCFSRVVLSGSVFLLADSCRQWLRLCGGLAFAFARPVGAVLTLQGSRPSDAVCDRRFRATRTGRGARWSGAPVGSGPAEPSCGYYMLFLPVVAPMGLRNGVTGAIAHGRCCDRGRPWADLSVPYPFSIRISTYQSGDVGCARG